MIVLALDTALAAVQVAVADGSGVRGAASEPMARGHQERLAPLVAETLSVARATAAEVERVVVTTGPGSFTGLRVGLAFAKAFALARGAPCLGVGTLAALALREPGEVAAVIGAPHGRAYLQRFRNGEPLAAPALLALADAEEAVRGARLVGPGAVLFGGLALPGAGEWPDIAALALAAAQGSGFGAPDPIYLREVGAATIAERRAAAGLAP